MLILAILAIALTAALKRLYDAGVTLVPGTNAFGSTSFGTEFELYERVGIPAATVRQTATIVSARVTAATLRRAVGGRGN